MIFTQEALSGCRPLLNTIITDCKNPPADTTVIIIRSFPESDSLFLLESSHVLTKYIWRFDQISLRPLIAWFYEAEICVILLLLNQCARALFV